MSSARLDSVASDLSRLRSLKATGAVTPPEADAIATRAARAFMSHYAATGEGLDDAVTVLCEIATLPDEIVARAGVAGLFPSVIEPLADAFDPTACRVYNRLFARVIQYCRALPEGQAIDRTLRDFGLFGERALVDRAERIRKVKRFASEETGVKQVIVLSRVTMGADVAVTSLVLQKMKRLFPRADIVFLANEGARQLFGGDARITIHALSYMRGGGLMARLSSWLEVIEVSARETRGLGRGETLIIDPDSRLTQLGLLPVVQDDSGYRFFESRAYRSPGVETLGELTARWLVEVFGGDDGLYPYVSPGPTDIAWARALTDPLRRDSQYLVSINLGVGENPRKRIPDPFEEELLRALLAERATVILDQGAGEEEFARVGKLIERLTALGHRVTDLRDAPAPDQVKSGEIMTWQGGIGRLGALIAQSDLYIGYDSAGQHIAAAVGVPTIDIFAGHTSSLMPVRWRPYGPGPVSLVTLADASETGPKHVLDKVLHHYRRFRTGARRRAT